MNAPLRLHRPERVAVAERPPDRAHDAVVRRATAADVDGIAALIAAHERSAHLLARDRDEIAAHAARFLVAESGGRVVACADLAPLGRTVAEVRSLVVDACARNMGLGQRLLEELTAGAAAAGFSALCAFTHAPAYFVARGFSIVPHEWLPEKIQADCSTCPRFRHCGQYAVVLPLAAAPGACVPLASLHG